MVQFNHAQREITLKIVYYGPALSGKTTNLQLVHKCLDPQSRGRLMTLDTADDRTLFFDLLPVFFKTKSGFKVKLKLYTVPGQVMHASTRRIVLSGADGVVFVADSQLSEARANTEAWNQMMQNLKENGLLGDDVIPIAVQFNKRDLPNVRTDDEIEQIRKASNDPVFTAVAIRGEGVIETFFALLRLTFRNLNRRHDFAGKFGLSEKEFLRNIFQRMNPEAAGVSLQPDLKAEVADD
ncbi:MAG: GTPase domain-containing protein [Deltaproteobacteria bacterium]|nr:GTPase domain-containing protein [Deltaproteobacteria bacterium]